MNIVKFFDDIENLIKFDKYNEYKIWDLESKSDFYIKIEMHKNFYLYNDFKCCNKYIFIFMHEKYTNSENFF